MATKTPPRISIKRPVDDLFTVLPNTSTPTARITCRACRRPAEVAVDSAARLCGHCASDPAATIASVRAAYAAAFHRVNEAWLRFDADMAHADEGTVARWGAYMDAGETAQVLETRRKVRAGLVQGPLADLIAAHCGWLDAHGQLVEAEAWRNEAMAELELIEPNAAQLYREP